MTAIIVVPLPDDLAHPGTVLIIGPDGAETWPAEEALLLADRIGSAADAYRCPSCWHFDPAAVEVVTALSVLTLPADGAAALSETIEDAAFAAGAVR